MFSVHRNEVLVQIQRLTIGIIFALSNYDNHSDICYGCVLNKKKMIYKQLIHCTKQNTVLGSFTLKIEITKSLEVNLKTVNICFL